MGLHIVILAAGSGKRMASEAPKILHCIGGVSMLERVVMTAQSMKPEAIHVIYGNGGELVPTTLQHLPVNWVKQDEQLGTGHAVSKALPFCNAKDQILVLYGDVPLISIRTLRQLKRDTPHNGLGLVVTELEDPAGFGRIIRNEMGNITAIVEHKDATPTQRKIQEINTGILTTSAKHLKEWLPKLKKENKQGEYYLTDIVALAVDDGHPVGGVMAHCHEEVQGVNDRWEQAHLERYFQETQAKLLAYSGVTVRDPARLDVRGQVKVGKDVILDVNVVMEGNVEIGNGCIIGPGVVLKDVTIGRDVEIKANSVLEGAKVGDDCVVGPFARLRPGTVLEKQAQIGNFVEIKKTRIGKGSKVNHLTYMGDSTVGKSVNVGAGVITCNYDGVNKWPTTIADGAFVGSNCSLIAPVKIGKNATIGSGSIITKDAPADRLTLSVNLEQRAIKSWKEPTKQAEKRRKLEE
ncbi:MAG: bifunctional UDP-N-acetylglucosamine diphosphorylase/glucosamine-1-phosphate N-acetyltransferase GlmU [Gammaproteobacteria bacterium]|nr:bifunctional UDP-N-acetylglucosamine diphosphorylase/glucosamine-1-phosphate N-acetyltransferase GlmU [Gammaproteobacteria bacterium]